MINVLLLLAFILAGEKIRNGDGVRPTCGLKYQRVLFVLAGKNNYIRLGSVGVVRPTLNRSLQRGGVRPSVSKGKENNAISLPLWGVVHPGYIEALSPCPLLRLKESVVHPGFIYLLYVNGRERGEEERHGSSSPPLPLPPPLKHTHNSQCFLFSLLFLLLLPFPPFFPLQKNTHK